MVEFTKRQKVEHKLKSVKQSREFFGKKNPNVDFTYTDALIANAEYLIEELPDVPETVYKPVWERLFGAETALFDAVQDDLKLKFKKNAGLRRDLSAEFVTSVLEVCDKVYSARTGDGKKEGRNLLIDFTFALGNSKKLFELCNKHNVAVPNTVYNDVAKFHRHSDREGSEGATVPFGKARYSETELKSFVDESNRRNRRRPVVSVDAEIRDLGNDNVRLSDLEEMDNLASKLVLTVLETIQLRLVKGQNPESGLPQRQCVVDGIRYVLEEGGTKVAENALANYEIIHKGSRTSVVRFRNLIEDDGTVAASKSTPVVASMQTAPPDLSAFKGRERTEKPKAAPKEQTGRFLNPEDTLSVPTTFNPSAPVLGMTSELRAAALTQRQLASKAPVRGKGEIAGTRKKKASSPRPTKKAGK